MRYRPEHRRPTRRVPRPLILFIVLLAAVAVLLVVGAVALYQLVDWWDGTGASNVPSTPFLSDPNGATP